MPGNPDPDAAVKAALASLAAGDLPQVAPALFGALGYRSTRVLAGQSGRVEDFIAQFPAPAAGTASEENLQKYAAAIHILFQVTDEEINEECSSGSQGGLFDTRNFDQGLNKSYLFLAVELNQSRTSRSQYAEFTREINKRFPMPAFLLFRGSSGLVTLAFVQRRRHKRDDQRRVLGSVSLIRDIDPRQPHRAHRSILKELSLAHRLAWMGKHGKPGNFDGLLAALLASLDTQELNKRFYKDLFGWFNRAVAEARFPANQKRTLPPQEHVLRLITRLLFVWFIKEKGLVAEELFIEEQVRSLLKNYDLAQGDSYYRAVLQNLFFATLNTEISQRGFSARRQTTHRDFSRYRHQEEMADPESLLALFKQTPFINGGLFDCLDSFDATGAGGYRIDCFSDNPGHRNLLSVPNRLFFAADGLVSIFNRYKFTVEENTPVEQEVALDPELLGKVFENLLAAINPETRETARRQTGSYYTPRLVVDTMVEEALVAALAAKAPPHDGDRDWLQERLRYLLDYEDAFNDARELFEDAEAEATVGAIAGLKVLDPAVGSGAFPMGILHKLTLALQRLDPDNTRWQALQKERAGARANAAFETRDQQERDAELLDISQTFQRYSGDFGRKLYLIQNSIFGVDIQPVACQIAKLRFFISLAIEQQPNNDPSANYGVKPLPNLETRFVAADTLRGLKKPSQMKIGYTREVYNLQAKLATNREKYFHANTRSIKMACRRKDAKIRQQLASHLQAEFHYLAASAAQLATWNPYDQNTKTDWFDAEYMFGVANGFDVVIGNPPYNQLQEDGGKLGKLYKDAGYVTFARTGDIYQLFYERGCRMLRAQIGILAYITSNSWLKAEYGKKTRRYLAQKHTPTALLELGKDVFESAIVDSSILLLRQGGNAKSFPAVDLDQLETTDFPPPARLWGSVAPEGDAPWSILSVGEQSIMEKMRTKGTPLRHWDVTMYRGVTTGLNEAFIIDEDTRAALVAADPKSGEILKPVLRGRDIQRYRVDWKGLWLIATLPALGINIDDYPAVREYLLSFGKARLEQSGKKLSGGKKSRKRTNNAYYELQDACAYYEEFSKEKLFWMDLTERGRFAYAVGETFCLNTAFMITGYGIKYLCAVLNSTMATWFMGTTALNSGMGVTRWIKHTVEQIPIPKISDAQQKPFIELIDHILQAKAPNPSADTSTLEAEIDHLVYQLYGLTSEEIAVVEGSSPSPREEGP
ncbi:MAG: hypothetical protein F4226_04530 [Synechococcus sp. SB0678_bin_12]|nr:hypothetical protein [Synechococcus sp. SB0678_bin_12]MYI87152.1 hypothetical protein [Synechococcus sp. SB0672_bin_10]